MNEFIGKKVLMTTDRWFFAPDGNQYRAVWGTLKVIHEAGKSLGFIPNRSHANWFYEIGNMIIMGCQVLYITACPDKPNTEPTAERKIGEKGEVYEYKVPTVIYICPE
jgi:hypothetical protein